MRGLHHVSLETQPFQDDLAWKNNNIVIRVLGLTALIQLYQKKTLIRNRSV